MPNIPEFYGLWKKIVELDFHDHRILLSITGMAKKEKIYFTTNSNI